MLLECDRGGGGPLTAKYLTTRAHGGRVGDIATEFVLPVVNTDLASIPIPRAVQAFPKKHDSW